MVGRWDFRVRPGRSQADRNMTARVLVGARINYRTQLADTSSYSLTFSWAWVYKARTGLVRVGSLHDRGPHPRNPRANDIHRRSSESQVCERGREVLDHEVEVCVGDAEAPVRLLERPAGVGIRSPEREGEERPLVEIQAPKVGFHEVARQLGVGENAEVQEFDGCVEPAVSTGLAIDRRAARHPCHMGGHATSRARAV